MQYKTELMQISKAITHTGAVRRINEDAYLDAADRGVWAVADGMGGHAAGDVASRIVIECLAELPASGRLSTLVEAAEEALLEANRRLLGIAIQRRQHTIGTTVAVLLVRDQYAAVIWAGDSRVYRLRGKKLLCLTQDHAVVEELVASGLLRKREAMYHPQANMITRAIGARPGLYLDIELYDIRSGDIFLLCTDGLYKEISERELKRIFLKGETAVDKALDLALARGARDNVTAVGVHFA